MQLTCSSTTNVYWCLKHTAEAQSLNKDPSGPAHWIIPPALKVRIRPGHRIVLTTWNDVNQIGRVAAVAVCTSLCGNGATVNWSPSDAVLRPLAQGLRHWRNKDFFAFADSVVLRYCLDDLFAKRLGDVAPVPRKAQTVPTGRQALEAGQLRADMNEVLLGAGKLWDGLRERASGRGGQA